jgi:alkylation response protein AidB-like acyl-CoA dehydrogenase
MDWSFTEEQEQVAGLTRQILERELTEERMREIERADDRYDARLFGQLGEAGVIGVALPEAHGGGGLGLIEQCRVLQEIGRAVAPVPALATMVAGSALAEFGSDELQRAYLPDAARGAKILTVALSEELNLDPSAPTTQAVPSNGGWTLTGQKTTVPAGTIADVFLVPAAGPDGVGVFVVERGDDGVSVERQQVTNTDAEALVSFDGVTLGADRRLAGARRRTAGLSSTRGGSGGLRPTEAVEWLVRLATVSLCAVQLGVCERALELTAEYSKTRVQFDRPIATFQAVGQRLADAYIDVHAIRLTTWQAAWRLSERLACHNEVATAKFWAADAGHRVAHTAVHVHGGMGIDLDYPLNRYFVAAKRIEFALGGATEQLVALGRDLASEPA